MTLNHKLIYQTLLMISYGSILLILNYPTSSFAHDGSKIELNYSKNYDSCRDKAAGVTSEMLLCITKELKIQDKRLNENYKRYLETVQDNVKKKLKAAQLAWIQFRDKECEFIGSHEEGKTLESVLISECHLDMTSRRADELE